MPPPPANWYYVHLSEKAQDRIHAFQDVLEKNNAVYPFNLDNRNLPFFFGVGRFKGGGSKNRVDVYVEFPAYPEPLSPFGGERKFTATAVFFDVDFREVDRSSLRIAPPPVRDLDSSRYWVPAQLVFSLDRDYYRMAVTIEERVTGRRSSYRANVVLRDYGTDITISDIVLCTHIRATETETMFRKGSLEVIPRARREYEVGSKVPIYFEVYNLEADDRGVSSYEVEYWLISSDLRKAGLWYQRGESGAQAVSRIDGSAWGTDIPIHVTIDTGNLWPGEFELHVQVTDARTFFVTDRMTTFSLVEAD